MATLIPISRLALMLIPTAVVIGLLLYHHMAVRGYLWAIFRMAVQLLLVGYILVYLFRAENAWPILGVLVVMSTVAAWISLRTVPAHRRRMYGYALLALALGGGSVLALVTQAVLGVQPWYHPQTVIPLAGMIFSNAMNGISLAADRLQAELERGTLWLPARGIALNTALIPITNALLAVGLVSLPGMMTGQILSGVSPLIAVRYQIMVMLMIFSAIGLSTWAFLWFSRGVWQQVFAANERESAGSG